MPKTAKVTSVNRHFQIRRMLHANRQVSVPALAEKFGVTQMTIHRDLDKLQRAGHIKKTWGGAVPAEKMVFEFDFEGFARRFLVVDLLRLEPLKAMKK